MRIKRLEFNTRKYANNLESNLYIPHVDPYLEAKKILEDRGTDFVIHSIAYDTPCFDGRCDRVYYLVRD